MLYLSQQGTGLSVEELEKIRKENENLKKKLEKTEDKFDELEARLQCPICLSDYNDQQHYTVKIKCGHVFGKSCLQKAFTRSGVSPHCPICKKASKIQQAIRIYI
ncbi:unnamed protein product [Oikopleura dioica]|uniref:RING-type domain-containing protein n=1 Tax=Oikopleura dioica TaxID=34765 RepID=E4YVV1_OIKDI|nr:unnamed protein product [Oikopleura dioica]